jgi:hypothetical protein
MSQGDGSGFTANLKGDEVGALLDGGVLDNTCAKVVVKES